jgi:hypothetical protein
MYHIDNREFGEIISVNHMVSDIESLWHDTEFLKEYYLNTRDKVIKKCHYGSDDQDAYIEIIIYDGKFREIVISDKNIPSDKIDSVIDNRGMRRLNSPVIIGRINISINIYDGYNGIDEYVFDVFYRTEKSEESIISRLITDGTINKHIKDNGEYYSLSLDDNGKVVVDNADEFGVLITNTYLDGDEYIVSRTHNSKRQNN